MIFEFRRIRLKYQIRRIQLEYWIARLRTNISSLKTKVKYALLRPKNRVKFRIQGDQRLIGSASKAIASPPSPHTSASDKNHDSEKDSPAWEDFSEGCEESAITLSPSCNLERGDEDVLEWIIRDARMQSGLTHLQLEYLKQEIYRLEASLNHREWVVAAGEQIGDLEYMIMRSTGGCYVT